MHGKAVRSKSEARSIDDQTAYGTGRTRGTAAPAPYLAGPDMRRQDQGRDALQEERPLQQWTVPPAWRALHRAKDRRGKAALRCQREMSQAEAQDR